MIRQKQILVTVTYNDLGCIIDTKTEPYEEPNLQPTCNQLSTDCISRQEAIDAVKHAWAKGLEPTQYLEELPPAQPEPCEDAGEKTCRTCHLWEDGEINIACPWGSNYEHYEDDYCSLWEKQN